MSDQEESTQEVTAEPPPGWPMPNESEQPDQAMTDDDGLEDKTVDELREHARALDIKGRSSMNKDELIAAIRNH